MEKSKKELKDCVRVKCMLYYQIDLGQNMKGRLDDRQRESYLICQSTGLFLIIWFFFIFVLSCPPQIFLVMKPFSIFAAIMLFRDGNNILSTIE